MVHFTLANLDPIVLSQPPVDSFPVQMFLVSPLANLGDHVQTVGAFRHRGHLRRG
jgi:hypothetical protein